MRQATPRCMYLLLSLSLSYPLPSTLHTLGIVSVGPLVVSKLPPPSLPEMEKSFAEMKAGGMGRPADCVARHRVAIIIPFRDRLQHLQALLYNLHPVLLRQQIDYQIFVIEQEGEYERCVVIPIWPVARGLFLSVLCEWLSPYEKNREHFVLFRVVDMCGIYPGYR